MFWTIRYVEFSVMKQIAAYVRYDGSFDGRDNANQGSAGLRATW